MSADACPARPPLGLAPGNPMTKVLMSVTAFEIIVFGLSAFVMIQVSQRPVGLSFGVAGVAALLALVATATLRRPLGFWLGWLTQVVAVAMGFLTAGMFAMAALFGGLWVTCYVLGRRLEDAAPAE